MRGNDDQIESKNLEKPTEVPTFGSDLKKNSLFDNGLELKQKLDVMSLSVGNSLDQVWSYTHLIDMCFTIKRNDKMTRKGHHKVSKNRT